VKNKRKNQIKYIAMDAFTYNNIFDTKGIEYLIIIVFFAVLIPFWLILSKRITVPEKIRKIPGILSAAILRIPQGLLFCRNHTWAYLTKKGVAEVGIDDLLVHITGEVSFSALKKSGEKISKGEVIAELRQDGKKLSILSPVSGEITEINNSLLADPTRMTADPYGKGWMFRISPAGWSEETGSYYLAEDAVRWMRSELSRFRDFLMESASEYTHGESTLILQDGGELRDNTLSELPENVWNNFQEDFLGLGQSCSRGGICD
jgi:glycine cleavage system H protein